MSAVLRVFCYQLHASTAAILLSLCQFLHLQPHVLQTLLVVAGVLSLPSLSLGALLQLLSQPDHAVPQTQHQHLPSKTCIRKVKIIRCTRLFVKSGNASHPYLKPLDLPPLKLQLIFQITYSCLLFTDDTAPHSGGLQKLHPRHTLLELHDRGEETEPRSNTTNCLRRSRALVTCSCSECLCFVTSSSSA